MVGAESGPVGPWIGLIFRKVAVICIWLPAPWAGNRNLDMTVEIKKGTGMMKTQHHWHALGIACVFLGMAAASSLAQIVSPLAVGNVTPATDVLGRTLPGNDLDPDPCLVEIRKAGPGGYIVPPDPVTGAGDTNYNPLVRNTHIGHGAIGTRSGLFSEIFTNRLEGGVSYFARVFDRTTAEAALYYADSALFDEPSSEATELHVTFASMRLVSGEADIDSDGDGIPDALELEEFGTDPTAKDTDEDGYDDGFEVAYDDYLDPGEPDVNELRVTGLEDGGDYRAAWWAIPGVAYRLEFRPAWIDGIAYTQVWSGAASGTNLEISVQNWMLTNRPKGFFRYTVP